MGLFDLIQDAVVTALEATDDLTDIGISYVSIGAQSRVGGNIVSNNTTHAVNILFTEMTAEQAQVFGVTHETIQRQSRIGLLAGKGLAFTPKNGDYVTRSNGQVLEVADLEISPGNALYTILFKPKR